MTEMIPKFQGTSRYMLQKNAIIQVGEPVLGNFVFNSDWRLTRVCRG